MSILKTYRPVLIFIIKFAVVYTVLVSLYSLYLSMYGHQTDGLTRLVGKSVSSIFRLLGIDVATPPIENEHGLKLLINGDYVARIVEGCTAASVIMMFVAFIVAFGHSISKSLLFAIGGSLLIFIFNILRIVFLGYLMYRFPAYQDVAHRIVFPALIYGFVVLLWIVFVKKINMKHA